RARLQGGSRRRGTKLAPAQRRCARGKGSARVGQAVDQASEGQRTLRQAERAEGLMPGAKTTKKTKPTTKKAKLTATNPLQVPFFDALGERNGEVDLPKAIF